MSESRSSVFVTGSKLERLLVGLLTVVLTPLCLLILFCAKCLAETADTGSETSRLFAKFWSLVLGEFFTLAQVILLLGFLWACFRPKWTERLLLFLSHHFRRAFYVVVAGIVFFAALGALIWLL